MKRDTETLKITDTERGHQDLLPYLKNKLRLSLTHITFHRDDTREAYIVTSFSGSVSNGHLRNLHSWVCFAPDSIT